MAETKLIDNQFVEIVVPQAPADQTALILTVISVFAVVILILLYFFIRRNAKIAASRKLHRIEKHNATATMSARRLAFEVAETLRAAFHVSSLDRLSPANGPGHDWQQFRFRLSKSCYAKASPTRDDIDELVSAAKFWLRCLSTGETSTSQ